MTAGSFCFIIDPGGETMRNIAAQYIYFDGPKKIEKAILMQTELTDDAEVEKLIQQEAEKIAKTTVKIMEIREA